MKIETNPFNGDEIPLMLYEAHTVGAQMKSENSTPCSLCRKDKELNGEIINRDHFHGSDLGQCARKTYRIMKEGSKEHSSNAAFLNDGHLHEHSMLSNLMQGLPDGWQIKPMENKSEKIFNIFGYQIIGHIDALMVSQQDSELIYVLECKSVKDYTFNEVKKGSISDVWYGQAQSYMLMLQLKRTYFVVKNRLTSLILPPIRIDFDPKYVATRLNVLKDIHQRLFSGDEQPNRAHPTSKNAECKFCPYGNEIGDKSCWQGE